VGIGSVARQDFAVIAKFSSDEFEVRPARELGVLLGYEHPVLHGADAGIKFLHDWFDAWGDFDFTPQEGIDFGDGRVLLLNELRGRGAASGLSLRHEEAELWVSKGGLVVSVEQWWSWREALQALGVE